jgi:acetate kinase
MGKNDKPVETICQTWWKLIKGHINQRSAAGEYDLITPIPDHKRAMELVIDALLDAENGILSSIDEIGGVGHRVVHGGEKYAQSVVIDNDVMKAIEENIELAPLHNPPNLTGIRETMAVLPNVKQVAVFDTAFHQTLKPENYLYGLPYELYEKHRIRRYGFHGTSHRYVASEALTLAKRSPENTNLITCHLGNGASVTAIENGESVDTSMGFTPLEGLIMGTRCGDMDPSIATFLMDKGYTASQLNTMMNKQSGLLGMSGISNDLRDLEKAAEEGNQRAITTLDAYANRIRKYIGAYAANLVKVDILVFTGGIGQHGVKMRERICNRLENLGMVMDYERNAEVGSKPGVVSQKYSRVDIVVLPTNEELQIAIDAYQLIFDGDEIVL